MSVTSLEEERAVPQVRPPGAFAKDSARTVCAFRCTAARSRPSSPSKVSARHRVLILDALHFRDALQHGLRSTCHLHLVERDMVDVGTRTVVDVCRGAN